MKLLLPRAELKEALAGLSKVVNARANLLILSHVRLDAEGQTVRLTGTDISQTAVYTITVAEPVPAPVSILIPLAELQAVLKTAQGANVDIEPGRDAVTLTATVAGQVIGRRIETPDLKDWPELAAAADTQPVEPGFLAGLRQALTFASPDDNRPLLKSAYLDVEAKAGHRIVATDSRRLSVFPCETLPLAESVIVPSTRFLNWSRLEGSVQIGAGKGVFTLRCGPWTYSARTVEGVYPRWSQVVPAYDGDRTLELSEADAAMLIKALPGLPTYDNSQEAVVLRMEGDAVRVYSRQDARSPESAVRLESSRHEGNGSLSVGLNRDFFREALQAGFRYWVFQDAVSPLLGRLFRDDKSSTHVLMPIRTIDNDVQRAEAPAQEPQPVSVPVQPESIHKETTPMKKTEVTQSAQTESSSLDKIMAAFEAAKSAVRQAQAALGDLAAHVRDAVREDKSRQREIADVRIALQKLQAIKV